MEIEDEIPDNKDASRPFLLRNKGEVGIYLDAMDAKAANPKDFGLEHAFMMALEESLYEYLTGVNLVKIKGALEQKGLFKGVILEEFRKGMVLVVTFDDIYGLKALWTLHEKDKLSALFQELLITKETLNHCSVLQLSLRAKMWEDEYTDCMSEIRARSEVRLSLTNFKNDIPLLREIRDYQKTLGEYTMVMRDIEHDFERNLEEFFIAVRGIIPENTTIENLTEFRKSVTVAKGARKTGLEIIEKYLKNLDLIQTFFADIEVNVCYRLSQIHGVCETKEQKALKEAIRSSRKEMEEFLKPNNSLLKVRFREWESKVLHEERKMFTGLVSLIPFALEKLIDMDHCIDDYITKFPDQLKER